MHRPPFVPRQDWWRPMISGRGIDGLLRPSSHAFQHYPLCSSREGRGTAFVDSTFHVTPKILPKEEVCSTDTFSGFCRRVPQHESATWIYRTYFQVSVASFQNKEQICYSAPQIRQRTAPPYPELEKLHTPVTDPKSDSALRWSFCYRNSWNEA